MYVISTAKDILGRVEPPDMKADTPNDPPHHSLELWIEEI